jgi:hypothetical protein
MHNLELIRPRMSARPHTLEHSNTHVLPRPLRLRIVFLNESSKYLFLKGNVCTRRQPEVFGHSDAQAISDLSHDAADA